MNKCFIANVTFLLTEEGGRVGPAKTGYRPHVEFEYSIGIKTSGVQEYTEVNTVYPGEIVEAKITLLNKTLEYKVGENFRFYEGARCIGYGQVVEILN